MPDTWLDIITDVLYELGVYAPGDPIAPADTLYVARKADGLLDEWTARQVYAYNVSFQEFTLTPGHAPHLIGPGLTAPDFAAAVRPVRVEGAALVLNTSATPVDSPILNIRDDAWWRNQRVKSLGSSVPTDLYYSPDWPNGALNFWPIPNFAYGIRLELWGLLGGVPLDANGNYNLAAAFSFPPGYKNAITLTTAEYSAGGFSKVISPDLARRAVRARSTIQGNNATSPRIASTDYGTRGKPRGSFNYRTGQ